MGKVNTRARVETLRVWLEDVKKGKRQPVTNTPIANEHVKFRKYNGR